MKKGFKFYVLCAICIWGIWALTAHSATVANAVKDGCTLCADVIIPSLFPFLFLSLFIVKSKMADLAGQAFSKITTKIYRLPGCAAAVILTSLVGGYPAGAQTAAQLCRQGDITPRQYQQLMCFCVCAGPAFLIETLGHCCFSSAWAGYILLAAQTISCLLLGMVACRLPFFENNETSLNQNVKAFKNNSEQSLSDVFVYCAYTSAQTMLTICSYVVLFTILSALLQEFGIIELLGNAIFCITKNREFSSAMLPALLETSSSCYASAKAGLIFTSFATSFGGLCVHFQIFSFSSGLFLGKLCFITFRVLAGLLSCFFTWLLLCIFPTTVTAFAPAHNSLSFASGSHAAAASLLLLCIAAIIMLPKNPSFYNYKNQ